MEQWRVSRGVQRAFYDTTPPGGFGSFPVTSLLCGKECARFLADTPTPYLPKP